MTIKFRIALAALALGTAALAATDASAHGIGIRVGGFGGGIYVGGFGPGLGFGLRHRVFVRPAVILPVYGVCHVKRWITFDGYYAARRVCY